MSRYSTPNEHAKCQAHGCAIDLAHGEEILTCQHDGCLHSKICIGCVFTCADCSEDFCEKHTLDLLNGEGPGALIVCLACLKQRQEPKEKAA
jgi:hypothetical protein